MAENEQGAQPTETAGREPHGAEQAESERDWKAEYEKAVAQSRKWEQRAKENKDAAARLADLEDASKTDAEKLEDAVRRAEDAEARLAEYERRAERDATVAEVAAAKGVDAELLSRMAGGTREEIEADADFIAARAAAAPIYPSVPDGGGGKGAAVTREQIDAIKDPAERVRMRARNIDLYRK